MTDWMDEGGTGHEVDVAAIMDSAAAELVWSVVAQGAMVSLGTTSDGGALSVTVTLDGRYRRQYFRDAEELIPWLKGADEFVAAEAERRAASPGPRKRPRRA